MPTYTRQQLKNGVTASANIKAGDNEVILVNNASSTAYFNIEGVNGKDLFNTHSISNPVNCTFISESFHVGVIVPPKGIIADYQAASGSIRTDYNTLLNSISGSFKGVVGEYLNVTASNVDLTASFELIGVNELGYIIVVGQGQEFGSNDKIIFLSQSFSNEAGGEDLVVEIQPNNLTTNGTSSFTFTTATSLGASDIKFRAANSEVYNINDTTSSGSFFGVDLSY